jgi:hypothetical protein
LALSPDGQLLAAGKQHGATVWNVSNGSVQWKSESDYQ